MSIGGYYRIFTSSSFRKLFSKISSLVSPNFKFLNKILSIILLKLYQYWHESVRGIIARKATNKWRIKILEIGA
jgi:hypothetical protein